MAPSYSGVWNISTQYQYASGWPVDANLGAIGLYAGGVKTEGGTSYLAEVDKLTLAANSNATDFGDMTVQKSYRAAASSGTRAIFGGGSSQTNVIDYVTISTPGNATDFGNLTESREGAAGFAGS